ncbi:hypothetical protein [Alkalicoccus luteus]|uniref:Uncharacterized protein n=1 Tax=Alkalicoccus luteus TaxID=1237094 RepID=A0A969PR77_9BACI|nr:hypothetical protein [Alkalicoccus luteus]NJP38930.1 hypothetical protein [Alkalicoccus luteus]
MNSRYHCCATCRHFYAEKTKNGMAYTCVRLGYVTKPNYQFSCWDPRSDIRTKMENEQ